MASKKEKVLGVLGGMGPGATADFFLKVIALTPAGKDQEHLHLIIDSNSKIPDRTECIRAKKLTPLLKALTVSAKRLEKAGAGVIAMPCNTAHIVHAALQKTTRVEILHLIKEAKKAATKRALKRPGLLATAGTVETGLYQKEFGDKLLLPDATLKEKIHRGILLIKAGKIEKARPLFKAAIAHYKKIGADSVILGCTDIPLAVETKGAALPILDTVRVLAEASLKACGMM